MKCQCQSMDIRVTGWRNDSYFNSMPEMQSYGNGWQSILKCSTCSQYWLVDHFDKVQSLFAVKIDSPTDVNKEHLLEKHIGALLKKYNGYSTNNCQFAGCNELALKGKAFCPKCLITKQGVYE